MPLVVRTANQFSQGATLERFYTLLSGLRSSILLVTDEGQIEYGNQAYCRYFGLQESPSDLKNFSAPEMISKIRNAYLDPDKAIARIAEIVDQGRPVLGEEVLMTGERACLRDFVPLYVGGKSTGRLWHHWDITERKQAEEALRVANERFALAFAANPAGIALSRRWDGLVLDVNETWLTMFGYRREEIIGKPVLSISFWPTPEDRALAVAELLEQGSYRNREQRVLTQSGESVMTLGSADILTIAGEEVILSTWLDITERKRVEEDLRDSKAKLTAALESMTDAVFISNVHGRFIDFNDAFATFHRFKNKEECAKTFAEYPDILDVYMDSGEIAPLDMWAVPRALRGETVTNAEYILRRKDSGETWIGGYSFAPIRDKEGAIVGSVVVGRDVTESKRAQQALRENERRLSMAVTATADAIWEWNLVTNQTYYSPRWFAMLGYEYNEISMDFDGWKSLCHPDDLQPTLKLIQSRLKSADDAGYAAEFRMRSKDGAWILGRGRVVEHDEAGKPVLLSGTNTDITERKQAEEAVRQLNESLEQRVIERTSLAESRARQLQALAVELIETEERERRQFAHLLHEDLQQMLAAAKMQVQAAADKLSSDPVLSEVAKILEESIAKSRRLSQNLSPAILHQAGLITALDWLARQAKEQFGLHVELNLNTELLMERTPQKVFLFRAVQELLFNIVKHASVKSAKVEVASSENSITVTVSDQGRGFDPQILEKRIAILGLGLLTIKERAGHIGGAFTIESALGQGSRFILTVPNAVSNGEEEVVLDASPIEELKPPRAMARKFISGEIKVLIVDDHQVMRQGLIKLVKGQPAIDVVGEASNGREAIEQARKLKPDLIVMDISMPEMDGIEASRRIKAELPRVRIIGLTMHDDPQLTGSMQQAGAEITLSKTLSAAELVKAIYGSQLSCD